MVLQHYQTTTKTSRKKLCIAFLSICYPEPKLNLWLLVELHKVHSIGRPFVYPGYQGSKLHLIGVDMGRIPGP